MQVHGLFFQQLPITHHYEVATDFLTYDFNSTLPPSFLFLITDLFFPRELIVSRLFIYLSKGV